MMACLDVAYHGPEANAAAVLFHSWDDSAGKREIVARVVSAAEYLPGQFYRRELPCLLALLALIEEPVEVLIVDGYVWLGKENQPGLGAHLYEALGRSTAVIGVAKSRFAGADGAAPVQRGSSHRPLQVTAAGMDVRADSSLHRDDAREVPDSDPAEAGGPTVTKLGQMEWRR